MARVRRSVWVAAVVCGVLLVSLVTFPARQGKDEEKSRKEEGSSAFEARKSVNASSDGMTKMRYSIPVKATFGLSKEPRLGETARVTYEITPSEDVPEMRVSFDRLKGVELVSRGTVFHSSADKGETKVFSIEVRFVSSPVDLGVWVRGKAILEDGTSLPLRSGGRLYRVIVDEDTGQFGTVGKYLDRVEFRYNPGVADWEPEPHEGLGPKNRRIIEAFKKLEPALTDSEALCLHYDFHNIAYLYWAPPKEGREKFTDEDVARYLLEQGWLKKDREGGKAKADWIKALSEKNRKLHEELHRRRNGSDHDSGSFLPRDSRPDVGVTSSTVLGDSGSTCKMAVLR